MRRSVWLALLLSAPAWALDPAGLNAAAKYSVANGGTVLLVEQNGRRLLAQTSHGGSLAKGQRIYSGTKFFWILAALAAEEDGLLELDERVASTIGEWSGNSARSRVTIRQLLDFTAGIEPNFALHGENAADRNASALRTRFGATPGARFIYGPAALQVFHEVFRRKLAASSQTPTQFLERRVLRPLELGSQRYLPDRRGHPLLSTGFIMKAGAWLRVGECLLRKGSPVLRGGFPATRGTSPNPMFNLALWNNHRASDGREVDPEGMLHRPWTAQHWSEACLCREAPNDLLACVGSGGQRLYVVPSQGLVIVRQASTGRFRDAEFLRRLFAPSSAL